MKKIKNRKLFVIVSALLILLDCAMDIIVLRALWKKDENSVD